MQLRSTPVVVAAQRFNVIVLLAGCSPLAGRFLSIIIIIIGHVYTLQPPISLQFVSCYGDLLETEK